jgi:hypothetical protein
MPCLQASSKHFVINMEKYHFYDQSPNEYSFTDDDLGLTTDESNFDQYSFYYNLEELQKPLCLRQLMTPFLKCSCQHCKSETTSYETHLSNAMKKCPLSTQI